MNQELPDKNFGWDCVGLAALILALSLGYCGCCVGDRVRTDGLPWSPKVTVKEAGK